VEPIFFDPGKEELVLMQVVSHVGIHVTPEVGRKDDLVTAMQIVPVRREGTVVYATTLRNGEEEPGTRVHLRPGDSLTFEPGSVTVELEAIDAQAERGPDGYAPLTNSLWTWLVIGPRPGTEIKHRYLLAAARRLDAAHRAWRRAGIARERAQEALAGPQLRSATFELIADIELAIIALARVIDMVNKARDSVTASVPIPELVVGHSRVIREIRNAYEHIEERALGLVKGQLDLRALTVFDHGRLITDGVIAYAGHELSLDVVPELLLSCRQFLKDVAASP
jgi:hypothetical protein